MSKQINVDSSKIKEKYFNVFDVFPKIDSCEKIDIPTNIIEESDVIIVLVDLCGVKKEDITIELSGKTLQIIAKRIFDFATLPNQKLEIPNEKLIKLVQLNNIVDVEKTISTFENGLLIIKLPIKNEKTEILIQ